MTKAFHGAYGWGANSLGGRGGTVIEVTNTNASGAGSLKAAIDANYPRIIVFGTGGIITQNETLNITNPYCTIAGQTAPGGGITIEDHLLEISTHNVIIRYLSWRGGANSFLTLHPGAGESVHDVIIDHCSASWGENDIIDIWKESDATIPDIYNITVQNCLFAEPHKDHFTVFMCGAEDEEYEAIDELHHISVHNNLFVHCGWRNPHIVAEHTEVINNVVYNWESRLSGTEREAEVDWVNNYFLDGPMMGALHQAYILWHDIDGTASLYLSGNITPNGALQTTPGADNWTLYREYDAGSPGDVLPLTHRRYSRLTQPPYPVPLQSAIDAYTSVLADVGANARLDSNGGWVANIDDTDTRLMADVAAGTGWADRLDVVVPGTIGDIDAGTAYTDTDKDGMPDDWENSRGLDPSDDTDGVIVPPGLGYTNLEIFLNGSISNDTTMNITTAALAGNLVPAGHYQGVVGRKG